MSSLGRFGGSLLPAAVGPAAENTLLAQLKQCTQQPQQRLCEEGDNSICRPHRSSRTPALVVLSSTWVCRRAPAWFWIFQDLSLQCQDAENFAPPFPDMSWFALSFSINHRLIVLKYQGDCPHRKTFSWDCVVTIKDKKKTYKRYKNTKAQGSHLPGYSTLS